MRQVVFIDKWEDYDPKCVVEYNYRGENKNTEPILPVFQQCSHGSVNNTSFQFTASELMELFTY